MFGGGERRGLSHLERGARRCLLPRPSRGAGGGGGGGAGRRGPGLVRGGRRSRRVGSVNRDGIPGMRARVCPCQGLCRLRRLPPCLSSARAAGAREGCGMCPCADCIICPRPDPGRGSGPRWACARTGAGMRALGTLWTAMLRPQEKDVPSALLRAVQNPPRRVPILDTPGARPVGVPS